MDVLLFIETGIQYVDVPGTLDFRDGEATTPHTFQISRDGTITPVDAAAENDFDYGDGDFEGIRTEGPVSFSPMDALDVFGRRWIPIPYQSHHPFWVKAFLEPMVTDRGQAYRIVLACDTHSRSPVEVDGRQPNNDGLGLLRSELNMTFAVNAELEGFWTHPLVQDVVEGAWDAWLRRRYPAGEVPGPDLLGVDERAVACGVRLRTLVRYLASRLPSIQVRQGEPAGWIDADLILDLGNARTCGIIAERDEQGQSMFAAMEMRSHDLPCRKTTEPFESLMQFVEPKTNGGLRGASIVRLGAEALEAGASDRATGALHGMSSPKRYLWDSAERPTPWCFVSGSASERDRPISGHVLRYIDPNNPYRPPQVVSPIWNPPNPNYSRKTGLLFFLIEILEQAFSQINSVTHREQMPVRGGAERRRVLRNIVLVHPSGMTPLEREELRNGAKRAVEIWYRAFRNPLAFVRGELDEMPIPMQPQPHVRLDCDEATAVQICYVYGEIRHRFSGHAERYLETMGRVRRGAPTLRLASLDIGGGTTDVVISDYSTVPGARGITWLRQRPLFRDGLSLGGDDVVHAVLKEVLLRQVAEHWQIDPRDWEELFKREWGVVDPQWQATRRQMVSQIWVPLVRRFWRLAETRAPEERTTIRRVLQDAHYPESLLATFNRLVSEKRKIPGFDLSSVEFLLNPDVFNAQVRRVLGPAVRNFCDVIAQFDCDVLLVAGRAAGLPELMRILVNYCPLPPARILSLQGYPIEGAWFPFAHRGEIADAKTCVVVGASVHYMATRSGGDFVLETPAAWPDDVIIGVVNPDLHQIEDRSVLFRAKEGAGVAEELPFMGQLWIGYRNIDDEQVFASALYELCWSQRVQNWIRGGMAAPRAYIQLGLQPNDPFRISVKSLRLMEPSLRPISRDDVKPKLRTSYTDDYWLDTGCFY